MTDYRFYQLRDALFHAGFVHAAATLHDRFGGYTGLQIDLRLKAFSS